MGNLATDQKDQQTNTELDLNAMATAIRALSMDAVEKANSGHPGMPMGMADVATVLFSKYLKFDPKNPLWPDRDRFILSAGHGSMLLYSLLYLTGYEKMPIEELKNFRQLHSKTPGHPEVMPECGIETTTGPLGQGISNAVGFALAERILNARFGEDIVSHKTYVIASDGDLMEGISHESCALAGHLDLSNLIVLYDDNGITIDGETSLAFSEDVTKRFEAYGWQVHQVDGHNMDAVDEALENAQNAEKPVLIRCKTTIGYGAPNKAGTASSHGAPLGEDEITEVRKFFGWSHPPFEIPENILQQWRSVSQKGHDAFLEWEGRLKTTDADKKQAFKRAIDKNIESDLAHEIKRLKEIFEQDKPKIATRKASGQVLEKLLPEIPELIGGSADLSGSNNTFANNINIIDKDNYDGQYIHYGVREHGMAAVMNGMALHGGIIPYGGTFLIFSDYCKPSIRLAALMKQQSIFVLTHDSIGLGEDGPTHQPVEHLAGLRAIPNLQTFRPCDGIEVAEAWELALQKKDGPTAITLSRQSLPSVRHEMASPGNNLSAYGAYILKGSSESEKPEVIILASGSEVHIALQAQEQLENDNIPTRVVSVPCYELFFKQEQAYIDSIIGVENAAVVGVEAAARLGWDRLLGPGGRFIGMNGFGDSAPADELYSYFGITAQAIVSATKEQLS